MIHKRRMIIGVLFFVILAVSGCTGSKNNRVETRHNETENPEIVNKYYVYNVIGEPMDESRLPENVVKEVPEDIELQEDEYYLGAEENPLTEEEKEKVLNSLQASVKTSAAEVKKEEKELGLKGNISYYFYNRLKNDHQKEIYRSLLRGFLDIEESFYVNVKRENMRKYYDKVMNDHPELFWVDSSFSYCDYGDYVRIYPDYNRSKEQVKKDKKKINDTVNKIVNKAKKEKTRYDRVLYVFRYLIRTVHYEHGVRDNQNVYSSLINKVTVCSGYSRATQLLLQKLGIQCIFVTGDVFGGGSHAWNILRLDKKYYHMDTTWGDAEKSSEGMPEKLRYDYQYFCTDDADMLVGRNIDVSLGEPSCKSKDKSFYVYNHRYFTRYDDKVRKSIRKNVREGKRFWHGQMANRDAFNALLRAVKNGLYGEYLNDRGIRFNYYYYQWDDDHYVIKLYY